MRDTPLSVLVVEDEPAYADALSIALSREGFNVRTAATARQALSAFDGSEPDIVLLDLMLPGGSGHDVCRELRRRSDTPIIMLTAKDSETDKVLGLELGADDYLTKPYSLRELVARMRAVLRRGREPASSTAPAGDTRHVIRAGGVELDADRHSVTVSGREVAMTLREFMLLEVLMSNAGRVVTRESLMDLVWGYDFVGESKTLDVHIQRVRAKIEPNPSRPTLLSTIRGLGYRFEKRTDEGTTE